MTQPPPEPSDGPAPDRKQDLDAPQRSVFSGARWHSMSSSLVQFARLFITVILANKLGREVFGLMAAVQVIVGFADYFKDAGIGQAIVRRPKLDKGFLSTLFYTNLMLGALISVLLALSASVLGQAIGEYQAIEVIQVLGLSVFITSTGVVQRNLYARAMRFDRIAVANILNALTYGLVAVVMAYMDFGIWAMVWGVLAGHVVSNAVLWVQCQWTPRWTYRFGYIKEIWVFCLGVLGSNLTNNFLGNIDRLIVQVCLGTKVLGSYAIAARLVTFPARNLGRALTSVMLPAFSRLQGDHEQYRISLLRACAGVALVTCPMMAGLMAIAPVLVEALFVDPEWEAAIPLIVWMGPLGVVLAVSLPLSAVYVSLGRSVELFAYGIIFGVISLEAYLIGSTYGVIGVAISGTLIHLLMSYFYFAVPFRFIGLSVRKLGAVLLPYLVTATLMGLMVWYVREALLGLGWDARLILAICVSVGGSFYVAVMLWLDSDAVRDLKRFIGWDRLMHKLGKSKETGASA